MGSLKETFNLSSNEGTHTDLTTKIWANKSRLKVKKHMGEIFKECIVERHYFIYKKII
jgi:hypothetical protein